MHVVAADDVWLVSLFAPALAAASRRRLAQLGLDAVAQRKTLEAIRRALEADGYLGRSELVERLRPLGIEIDASRRVHLFRVAVAEGIACLGPDRGSETLLALARDWLGEPPQRDRGAALAELARRYVGAFGPATEADFAGWSGLSLRDARAGLGAIGRELVDVRLGTVRAWMPRRGARRARQGLVRLSPAWDNYLMGHRRRDFIAAGDAWRRITPGGGLIRPVILVDGVAVGTWRMTRKRASIEVKVSPFADLDAGVREAIRGEVEDIQRFVG